MKKLYKYRKGIAVGAIVAVILCLLPFLGGISVEEILGYTPANPWLAALLLLGVYCVKPVLMMIPTYALYIVGGMLFAPGWGILIAYVGLFCEMSLGWLMGRWLGGERVRALAMKSKKAAKVLRYVEGNSPWVCFITRVLPMPYPVDVGSMLFGAAGMGYWAHMLFSLLGFSAVMIPITLAGGNLSNPWSAEFLVPFGISVALCAGLMVAYRLWMKRKAAGEEAAAEQPPAEELPEAAE